MCIENCILVHHSNLIRTMALLFCALNVFVVFVAVTVKCTTENIKIEIISN